MKKQILVVCLFIFCCFPSTAFAARSIVISADKSSLSTDDELSVTASTSGFTNGEKIYIKGAFFKDGSSNYFGLTKNNDSWTKNSTTALSQREVIIGNWDNSVSVKPDYSDSGFAGHGDYKFKLGFYYLTSGGNTSSVNWSSNDLSVTLDSPPSPIPSPTTVKSSATSSTKSTTVVSKAPTPTNKQPTSVTSSKTTAVVVSSNGSTKFVKIASEVRPASEFAKIKPISNIVTGDKKKVEVLGAKDTNYSYLLFLSGGLFLILAGGLFAFKELKERVS